MWLARHIAALLMILFGMYLMDVPVPIDPWHRWIWGPLGVVLIMFSSRVLDIDAPSGHAGERE